MRRISDWQPLRFIRIKLQNLLAEISKPSVKHVFFQLYCGHFVDTSPLSLESLPLGRAVIVEALATKYDEAPVMSQDQYL